jgi:hypothetical protein
MNTPHGFALPRAIDRSRVSLVHRTMRNLFFASVVLATACSAAYADQQVVGPQPPGPRTALAIAPAKIRAPYDVQVIREDGELLPTFAFNGRFYVQGNANDRYIIRVTNPTDHRVEAVVSVDGLDVVDGDPGDLHKRGYIVPAHGDVRVEGFRTSLADVATFRFSSVDGSYAGQKGKARNVGVIAVAVFEEQLEAQQQIVAPAPPPPPPVDRPYDWRDDVEADRPAPQGVHAGGVARVEKRSVGGAVGGTRVPAVDARPSAPQSAPHPAQTPPTKAATRDDGEGWSGNESVEVTQAPPAAPTHRPGLGTEFGEQRSSAASYTRFVRANNRPVAVAELRYNDTAGLVALGIPAQPLPDEGELMTRETADPFPGDGHFATPPRR